MEVFDDFGETLEVSSKEEKKNHKGLLNWFKLQVYEPDVVSIHLVYLNIAIIQHVAFN
jgi:hypothetical protein